MFTFLNSTIPSTEGMVNDSIQQLLDSLRTFSPEQIEQIKTISSNTLQQFSKEMTQESAYTFVMPVVCALVVLGIGFYFYKLLKQEIQGLTAKLKEQDVLLQTYALTLESFEHQLKKNESALSSLKMLPTSTPQKNESSNVSVASTNISSHRSEEKVVKRNNCMYADFFLDGGDAIVEQRDLSSKVSEGTFQIKIEDGASKAVYTVNQSKEKAILEDILNFTNFVTIQDIPASYSAIKVVKEGELVKAGANWKIVKKLEVKLI